MNLTPKGFQEILDKFDRVALVGAVESGKTLLLDGVELGREVHHTDKLRINAEFKDIPGQMVYQLRYVPRFIAVGMLVPHALRACLKVDAVVWIDQPRDPEGGPSDGLRGMVEEYALGHPEVAVYFAERALHEGELIPAEDGKEQG